MITTLPLLLLLFTIALLKGPYTSLKAGRSQTDVLDDPRVLDQEVARPVGYLKLVPSE